MDPENETVPTELAQNLKVAQEDDAVRYDASAKKLIAEKAVLAYILKSALAEYAPYTVQEIAKNFIEGTPEIGTLAVHQDHPDRESIEGLPTEDASLREGTVYFDIRFLAIVPKDGQRMEIFVNCEIQNNDTPGYPIPKRGIYYAARMISSQRGRAFQDQEYGKIAKAVSIWICEDTAEARSDTINRYAFAEECLRGSYHEEKQNYDLMTVVILRLGSKGESSADHAIRLLSKMFSTDLDYEKKLDALRDEFHISVTKKISREVLDVCNLSTGIYNKGIAQGRTEGIIQGRTEGIVQGRTEGMVQGRLEGRKEGRLEGRKEGRLEGRKEGRTEGIVQGRTEQARDTVIELRRMGISAENIAKAVKVNIETVQDWLSGQEGTAKK